MSGKIEQVEQVKSDYIEKLKKVKLAEAGVDYNDIDVYVKYVNAEDEKEIEKQASEIVADINQHNTTTDVYHDKRAWKPF